MFVALGIQHVTRIRHIVICGLSGYSIVPHYLINDMIFEGKKKVVCVDFRYRFLSEIFFILRRTERDMILNVSWSSCKVPVVFVIF